MYNFYNRITYRNGNICTKNKNKYNRMYKNELPIPVNYNIGYLLINVSSQQGKVAVPNPFVTIYVREDDEPVPIYSEVLDNSSVIISLPVAHSQGTLIKGPEYYFTTYNVLVTADGFAPYRCNNLRIFEGISIRLDVCMNPIIPSQYPIPEQIVDIPSHPRDQLNGLRRKYLNSFKL